MTLLFDPAGWEERNSRPKYPDVSPAVATSYIRGDRAAFFDALERSVRINDNDCWLWLGPLDANGYPKTSGHRGGRPVHRMSLEMRTGLKLEQQHSHHTCAVPSCVNPEHLQPATSADNTAEMRARGAFVGRILELESALHELDPEHPLLGQLPYGTPAEIVAYKAVLSSRNRD